MFYPVCRPCLSLIANIRPPLRYLHRAFIHRTPTILAMSQQQQSRSRPTQGELVARLLNEPPSAPDQPPIPFPLPLIDIGANICDAHSFSLDRSAVIERAHQAGLSCIVVTGSCLQTTNAAAALITTSEAAAGTPSSSSHSPISLKFTAGIHPHNARFWNEETCAKIASFLNHPSCVAVGECGLDFNRNFSPQEDQKTAFAAQIALAQSTSKPLFLHCRDAWDEFYEILSTAQQQKEQQLQGVLHCFTGNKQHLERALAAGLHIGITGWVCDDRPERGGAELAALLPLIPDDRLMIETDAPYLTPRQIRIPKKQMPHRNEPALLPWVLQKVAEARGQSADHVATITTENAKRLFSL